MSVPDNVVNKKLYLKIKNKVKNKVKSWPSAYGSSLLVKSYKEAGGKYSGKKPKGDTGLQRWFKEKWIDVCAYPKIKKCGRPKGSYTTSSYQKDYPYCRPLKRINKKSPKTVKELSPGRRKSLCRKKKSSPKKKMKKA
jgi:Family of unknown function (DUF5872)